jgi:hypothetical protein
MNKIYIELNSIKEYIISPVKTGNTSTKQGTKHTLLSSRAENHTNYLKGGASHSKHYILKQNITQTT